MPCPGAESSSPSVPAQGTKRARGQLLPPGRSPDSTGREHDSVFTSHLAGPPTVELSISADWEHGGPTSPPTLHGQPQLPLLTLLCTNCSPALPLRSVLPLPHHYSPCSLCSPQGLRALTLPAPTLLSLFLLLSPPALSLLLVLSLYSPSVTARSLHASSSAFSPLLSHYSPTLPVSPCPLCSLCCLLSLLLP